VRLFGRRSQPAAASDPQPRPLETRPTWGEVGIHGIPRAREWDAVVLAHAELDGDHAVFAALADGTFVIEEGPDGVAPLADALAGSLAAPYRAEAIRRPDGSWSVGAKLIRVVELPEVLGSDVMLTLGQDGRELVVDGITGFGTIQELEDMLGGASGVVEARRLAGTAFELTVHTL
jgi:hypothetical protein